MATPNQIDQVENSVALKPSEKRRPHVLRINEIFYSIQGEGSRSGVRCIFIRLTGCGLRCNYCDTEYAFYEGTDQSIADILTQISNYDCKLLELTGGEPLEQEGVYTLMDALLSRGYELMIETGGHMDIDRVDARVRRIVDLKTPSSGMLSHNLLSNIPLLTSHDEVKFVIGDREDYLWSKRMLEEHALASRVGTVLFSPVAESLAPDQLAAWILEDALPVRYQVQLHKIIWPSVLRGV
jgi:7-carboxy-7-deazaguanine synthase